MSAYLAEELCKLGIDDDAILEYCSGLLEDDTMDSEEKQEAIVGYLEAILEQDVTALVLQALALQSEAKTQRALETQKSAQMALSEALEKEKEELQRDAQSQVEKPKEMTLEERKQREKLIAVYEYRNAEIVERADGESEIVVRENKGAGAGGSGGGGAGGEEGILRNNNAQLVAEKEKLARDTSRTAHQKKALTLFEGICKGDRRALARGITLVESTRSDHRSDARELVSACARMPRPRSLRIGLTGTPGVGKSTFIEAFGMLLINKGHRVSVLAVDPSSARSGGSILGDKTRMQDLSVATDAYVRPSPSRGSLGGVARNTLDSIILTEASGFDICLVETVGVGQSETMVSDMVDMFILLLQPGSGDELQGVKRGIMELADLIIINKADGNLELPAKLTRAEITNALHLMIPRRKSWTPKCLRASAATGYNLERVWGSIEKYFEGLRESGEWDGLRAAQQEKWMWREVNHLLMGRINADEAVRAFAKSLEENVWSGEIPPGIAAERVVDKFLSSYILQKHEFK
ncbi:hypothetical protein LPJ66_005514 [Kickxella alabastrina]|uniref:Uncharacterized protein n=1 Tax=Kickxella alabastrina TaxID=61397 RepID=A0ACC1IGM2_9FUNG|nr:hypothetical protein LPJ66_005514 [Kickxella alabastrina]